MSLIHSLVGNYINTAAYFPLTLLLSLYYTYCSEICPRGAVANCDKARGNPIVGSPRAVIVSTETLWSNQCSRGPPPTSRYPFLGCVHPTSSRVPSLLLQRVIKVYLSSCVWWLGNTRCSLEVTASMLQFFAVSKLIYGITRRSIGVMGMSRPSSSRPIRCLLVTVFIHLPSTIPFWQVRYGAYLCRAIRETRGLFRSPNALCSNRQVGVPRHK